MKSSASTYRSRIRTCGAIAAALIASIVVSTRLRADDWPQFRGPNCTGISTTNASLPTTFSATENVRWSADVGDGVGGAVVAAGRIFVSGMTSDDTVSLFAFDAATGQPL